jgi:glutathione peroxidase
MSLYDFSAKTLAGQEKSLADYKGDVALVVNVASKCGLTPQYAGLQALYRAYKDRGFVVLGFPCNQFGGQEPGGAEEIQTFCTTGYGVDFPMFSKIEVNGANADPLYVWLKDGGPDIEWNFAKFLIGRDGEVIRRIDPRTKPEDLTADIESVL